MSDNNKKKYPVNEYGPDHSWWYRKKFEVSDIVCLILLAAKLEEEKFTKDDMLIKMHRTMPKILFTVFDAALCDMINRRYLMFRDGYYSITDNGREEVAKIIKII